MRLDVFCAVDFDAGAHRESFSGEAELQEKLYALEWQLTRALHQVASMSMILVSASLCLYLYLI